MKLLPLRSNLSHTQHVDLPFIVYTVGSEQQQSLTRLEGYSANQLLVTFSGKGQFRLLGQQKWSLIEPDGLLYIPAGIPHEYKPVGDEPWELAYVSYIEKNPGQLAHWWSAQRPEMLRLADTQSLFALLEHIWNHSGSGHDAWLTTEALFRMCLTINKQRHDQPSAELLYNGNVPFTESVVDMTIRFLHDHLQLNLTMADLSGFAGYSPKHLTRLFQQQIGMTPMQYLQRMRLQTARMLLAEQRQLTIKQAAAYVGMDSVYFTRLFRRIYGHAPSQGRATPNT